jgi:5-methylcytosine-specific restriction endonuclease McrA
MLSDAELFDFNAALMSPRTIPQGAASGSPSIGSWTDPVDPLTADHVVPRADGGRYSELRPAHRSCNSGRGRRTTP